MSHLCPADFHPLQPVHLEHNVPAQRKVIGRYCANCGGAFLTASAQRKALGNGFQIDAELPRNGRPCPVCEERMRVMPVGRLRLEACASCNAIWFDAGELAVVALFLRDAGIPPAVPEDDPDPVDGIPVLCADTGEPADEPLKMVDMGFGLVSERSLKRPGFSDAPSGSGEHTFDYRGQSITVRHSTNSPYQGRVEADLDFTSNVQAELSMMGLGKKIKGLFGKKGAVTGLEVIDAAFYIETPELDALRGFLREHGVRELLEHLVRMADRYAISFSATTFSVEITGPKSGVPDELRRGCENLSRLLLDRLIRFNRS